MAAFLAIAPVPTPQLLCFLAGKSPAFLLAFLRKEGAGKSVLPCCFSPCVLGLLRESPSPPVAAQVAVLNVANLQPQFAAVLVSYSAGVLGERWPFPHPCLTGASRRTYHKARLLLAMRPIASWHAASGFFKTSVCEGIQLPCCCPN